VSGWAARTVGGVGTWLEIDGALPRIDCYREPGSYPAISCQARIGKRSDQVIERLGVLGEDAKRRRGWASQGNAQRPGAGQGPLLIPKLILLDEPANGLDPAGCRGLREACCLS